MKRKLLFLLLMLSSLAVKAEVKPISGTFINFFWQDERNNYMNQRNVDGPARSANCTKWA